jgi:hypothetical protein
MSATETTRRTPTRRAEAPPFVFFRNIDQPVFGSREPSLVDRYELWIGGIGIFTAEVVTTSPLVTVIPGTITFPVRRENPEWRTWLPELTPLFDVGVHVRSPVAQQVDEIQRITGLSDAQLAQAFPAGLTRETINRWRNRPNPNLREGNAYRLGLLYELAQRMEAAGIDARLWLHQAGEESDTPFELICQGQLADVRRAVDAIAVGVVSPVEPMPAVPSYRERDVVVDEEDDGDWVGSEE